MSEQTTVKTLTSVKANNSVQAPGKEENPITEAMSQGVKEASMLTAGASSSALEELLDFIQAIGPHQIRKLGISVPQAVSVGRHYAKCYAEDRAAFVRALNPCVFNPASYDNMETRAAALWEADVLLGKAEEDNDDVFKTADEARRAKSRLVRTAEYMWGEDEEKMEAVDNAKVGHSHMDLADAIFTLCHMFMDNLDEVKRRRTDTQDEVEETVDTSASAPENAQPVSDTPVPAV
jgi:hypothetical protein